MNVLDRARFTENAERDETLLDRCVGVEDEGRQEEESVPGELAHRMSMNICMLKVVLLGSCRVQAK